jgi:hypothetical protein
MVVAAFVFAATIASWLWFWRVHSNPPRRSAAAFAGFMCFVFAAFPALWVVEALVAGYMPCIWRGCSEEAIGASETPAAFWAGVTLLGALCAFFLGGTLACVIRVIHRPVPPR